MLASRLPGILPPLSEEDALEVAAVRSVCGLPLEADWGKRPFRQPIIVPAPRLWSAAAQNPNPAKFHLLTTACCFG
ncbi:hypothetical protein HSBAA_63310 [Vreelandella sulfidaeris]|uniref:Magnesium chelatase ChlI-like catalytic domain-containing protein n=1 Tax=Vreelandella sulfidaeris TaxID=115553 RepID=A0A455UFY5_9GAMM|nr:hypothetical protein HSBAA_63310 [Halomonas sulfidaeris]